MKRETALMRETVFDQLSDKIQAKMEQDDEAAAADADQAAGVSAKFVAIAEEDEEEEELAGAAAAVAAVSPTTTSATIGVDAATPALIENGVVDGAVDGDEEQRLRLNRIAETEKEKIELEEKLTEKDKEKRKMEEQLKAQMQRQFVQNQ